MNKEKKKKIIAVCGLIIFVALMIFLAVYIGRPLVKFIKEPEKFRELVNSKGLASRALFVALVAVQVVVAIIPGEPFEIAGGYAFGPVEGTLLVVAGILVGSVGVYFFSKKVGMVMLEAFFPREKIDSLKFLQNTEKVRSIMFLLFFIPGTPKDLLTYVAPFTKLKFGEFMLLAGVARLPSVITSTVGGGAMGGRKYLFAAIVFGVTLLLSAVGVIIYKRLLKKRSAAEEPEATPPNGE